MGQVLKASNIYEILLKSWRFLEIQLKRQPVRFVSYVLGY